jgi:hypothetical protein
VLRSTATTSNPASANPSAMARPIPLAAPVTITLLFRCCIVVSSSSIGDNRCLKKLGSSTVTNAGTLCPT